MSIDRKTFLKLGGCSLAAALAGQKLEGLLQVAGGETRPAENALRATRWAMVLDTRKCQRAQGCDQCIRACHQAHNVPDIPDRRREIKWIWKEPVEHAFPELEGGPLPAAVRERQVLLLCNHCASPPCVRVCPTKATWKRPEDGIVMMDWHRCIGCRYCVAACPYGSRSFNWFDPRPYIKNLHASYPTRTKGVVEKCTFCEERLAEGQLPACVEACPEKALIFGDASDPNSEVSQILNEQFALRRKPELGTEPQVFYLL